MNDTHAGGSFRLIALDLDGTLLSSGQRILPETRAALDAARARGIEVVMVTGRHHIMARPYHAELGLDSPAVCCNGTYLYDFGSGSVISSDALEKDCAVSMVEHARRHALDVLLYVDQSMCFEQATPHIAGLQAWAGALPAAVRPDLRPCGVDFETEIARAGQVWKIVVAHDEPERIQPFVDDISARLPVSCEWSWRNRVDVARTGNSKGARLAEWVRRRGYDAAEVIAFGDHYNDISMLSYAGLGVAMGNAEEAVKACADRVTESNDDNGIANALRRWVLE